GLFNREETTQTRKVDFSQDLGLPADEAPLVRDLWKHIELQDLRGGYATTLAPHSCQILRISPKQLRFEAEVASLIGGTRSGATHFNHSGNAYVSGFETEGDKVLFA